jgi:hypothetical protein
VAGSEYDQLTSLEPLGGGEDSDPYALEYDSDAEMERWYEERSRAERQLREDAEEEIWFALQVYGEPIADHTHRQAVQNLVDSYYDAQNAGDQDGRIGDYGVSAWEALNAALPKLSLTAHHCGIGREHAPRQRQRSSRRRRSTATRKSRSPGRSSDADPHLARSPGRPRATGDTADSQRAAAHVARPGRPPGPAKEGSG